MITLAFGISVYLMLKGRPIGAKGEIQLGGLTFFAMILDFIIFMTAIYKFS